MHSLTAPLFMRLVFVFSLLLPSSSFAQSVNLNGSVNMPTGVVPATSDLVFRVKTDPLDMIVSDNGQQIPSSTTVIIPRFSSSASFSLPLKSISQQAPEALRLRRLKFDCLSGCANIAITTTGFWGDVDGITSEANAAQFDIANPPSRVDINLERADLFAGIIEFPENLAAAGTEQFTVSLIGSQFVNPATFSQEIAALEGQTRLPFFIGAPPAETGGGWSMRLDCEGCEAPLIEGPFFATTAQGNPVSVLASESFTFLKGRSYSNLKLGLPREFDRVFLPAIVPLLLDD